MKDFKQISPDEFDGIFKKIGKDWMLIGASDGTCDNLMTASWGAMGILWHKPVAICFIRPQRYTYTLTEPSDRLSISFFKDEKYRDALTYCGRASGRNEDKFAGAGFTKAKDEYGTPYPTDADLVLLCRKMYADDLTQFCV